MCKFTRSGLQSKCTHYQLVGSELVEMIHYSLDQQR